MNSKLVKAALAGTAAIAVGAGGTTFALWSDYAETATATAEAGILKLVVGSTVEETAGPFDLAPGLKEDRVAFIASSDSNSQPNGDLAVTVKNVTDAADNCNTNSETDADDCESGGAGDLSGEAFMRITSFVPYYTNGLPPCEGSGNTEVTEWEGTLAAAEDVKLAVTELSRAEGICVKTSLTLSRDAVAAPSSPVQGSAVPAATNSSQGDSATYNLRYDLEQK